MDIPPGNTVGLRHYFGSWLLIIRIKINCKKRIYIYKVYDAALATRFK